MSFDRARDLLKCPKHGREDKIILLMSMIFFLSFSNYFSRAFVLQLLVVDRKKVCQRFLSHSTDERNSLDKKTRRSPENINQLMRKPIGLIIDE